MYPQNPMFVGGNSRLTGALFALPEFQEMYYRRLRTLMDTLLQPPDTPPELLHYETRIDALVEEIGADGDLDTNTWPSWGEPQTFAQAVRALREDYLAQRRAFVYGTWMQEVGGPLPMPVEPAVIVDEADPSAPTAGRGVSAAHQPDRQPGGRVRLAPGLRRGRFDAPRAGRGHPRPAVHLYVVADVPAFKARRAEPHGGQGLFVLGNWTGVTLDPDGELPTLTRRRTGVSMSELVSEAPIARRHQPQKRLSPQRQTRAACRCNETLKAAARPRAAPQTPAAGAAP
jgi:hypothetical protein